MKYDVFISYSSKDQKIAEGICGYLESNGYRCFVAYRDIPRGVVWAGAIADAIDESQMMVVVFSSDFNLSIQTDRELELASENKIPILTYKIADAEFSGVKKYYLKNINWIDAFPRPELFFGKLLDSVSRLLGKNNIIGIQDRPHKHSSHSTYDNTSNNWWNHYNLFPVGTYSFKRSKTCTILLFLLLIPLFLLFLTGFIKCVGGVFEGEGFCDGVSENVLLGSLIGIILVFSCCKNYVFVNRLRKKRKELYDNDYIEDYTSRDIRYAIFARGNKSTHKFGLFNVIDMRIHISPMYEELRWIEKGKLLKAIKDGEIITIDINGNQYQ